MDRGRVGTLAIGNKTIRDQMIAHQQAVHLERINKIKNRKPGSSNTLDNTAPVIVKAALVNPRKIAKKKEFNEMTDRENRVLLQRISNTLTAPAKITTEDYDRMHKIVVNLKGGKARYEEEVRARHHKIYLDHLKKMGPYYDPTEWELDYKRQKVQQMFMREVPYERPKDYKVKQQPRFVVLGSIHDKNNFKPHHTQMKGVDHSLAALMGRKSRGRSAGQVNRVKSIASAGSMSSRKMTKSSMGSSRKSRGQSYDYDNDDNFEEDDEGKGLEDVLACTHRFVKVLLEGLGGGEGADANQPEVGAATEKRWGEIICYAVEETLVITGKIKAEDGKPAHAAEAEIDICGLADIRGMDPDLVMRDLDELRSLAKDVSERVDMRISEEGAARITLNLADDPEEGGSPRKTVTIADETEEMEGEEGDEVRQVENDWFSQQNESSVEFENSFVGEDVFTNSYDDAFAEVHVVGIAKNKRNKNAKPEKVRMLAHVSCEVDKITVEVEVTSPSTLQYKDKPAVPVGAKFSLNALLPSIMSADVYLMKEYFHNLVHNLIIETNHMSGHNKMFLAE